MATRVVTYDPAKVSVSVAGNIIAGYAQGQMIQYRPDALVWEDALGVDNEPVRWASNNPMGTLTLILAMSSPSNGPLGLLLNLDRLTASQTSPVIVEDRSGGRGTPTRMIAKLGWVSAQPALNWGSGPEPRQWDIRLVMPLHDIHGFNETPGISI